MYDVNIPSAGYVDLDVISDKISSFMSINRLLVPVFCLLVIVLLMLFRNRYLKGNKTLATLSIVIAFILYVCIGFMPILSDFEGGAGYISLFLVYHFNGRISFCGLSILWLVIAIIVFGFFIISTIVKKKKLENGDKSSKNK